MAYRMGPLHNSSFRLRPPAHTLPLCDAGRRPWYHRLRYPAVKRWPWCQVRSDVFLRRWLSDATCGHPDVGGAERERALRARGDIWSDDRAGEFWWICGDEYLSKGGRTKVC